MLIFCISCKCVCISIRHGCGTWRKKKRKNKAVGGTSVPTRHCLYARMNTRQPQHFFEIIGKMSRTDNCYGHPTFPIFTVLSSKLCSRELVWKEFGQALGNIAACTTSCSFPSFFHRQGKSKDKTIYLHVVTTEVAHNWELLFPKPVFDGKLGQRTKHPSDTNSLLSEFLLFPSENPGYTTFSQRFINLSLWTTVTPQSNFHNAANIQPSTSGPFLASGLNCL